MIERLPSDAWSAIPLTHARAVPRDRIGQFDLTHPVGDTAAAQRPESTSSGASPMSSDR